MSESLKADGKIPSVLNLAQAAAGAFYFETSLLTLRKLLFFLLLKVARLDFFEGIPPKFEH